MQKPQFLGGWSLTMALSFENVSNQSIFGLSRLRSSCRRQALEKLVTDHLQLKGLLHVKILLEAWLVVFLNFPM